MFLVNGNYPSLRIVWNKWNKRAFFSTSQKQVQYEDNESLEFLENLKPDTLPLSKLFTKSFVRLSGPGGQKVNKTNSKLVISMTQQVLETELPKYVPSEVFKRYLASGSTYKRKSHTGGIVIASDLTRSRESNLQDCYDKFIQDLKKVKFQFRKLTPQDTKDKWDKLQERELKIKKREKMQRSEKKQNRRKIMI